MKYFPDANALKPGRILRWAACSALVLAAATFTTVKAAEWTNSEAGTAVEAALYRLMPMPAGKVLGLRPPREATPLITTLLQQAPTAELYSLRARSEEAALDFKSAEADWKKYAELSSDHAAGQLGLADYFQRRARPQEEVAALAALAQAASPAREKLTPAAQQQSWLAFERIFRVLDENALGVDEQAKYYRLWLQRYPAEEALYGRSLQFLLEHKQFKDAEKLIAQHKSALPADEVFPVKAQALLEYKRGSIEKGLAIYDSRFQPLWPQELIESYFALLEETRSQRQFLDRARSALERNPDDLNSAARIYYFYQRQGRADAAQLALRQYRERKERRNAKWNANELYTLARLSEGLKNYPEAARYYYALYNCADRADAPEQALGGLINVLLEAPEQNVQFGSGSLSVYSDIASMDRGPGFLNGILSLLMNSASPAYAESNEQPRAVPYFHRAQAAQLVPLFESRFPHSSQRDVLRARLAEAYAAYGEHDAVIREGQQYLAAFPTGDQREHVAMLLADSYSARNRPQDEFALYDAELAELARRSEGIPLSMKAAEAQKAEATPETPNNYAEDAEGEGEAAAEQPRQSRAFSTARTQVVTKKSAAAWYSEFLERYLSRLVAMRQQPQALAVLRKEVDRNPNDPGLYERLAQFLEQNQLGDQQEQVYERAMQQFQDRSWYHKLARLYLRHKKQAEFSRLSEQVIKTFSGTDLESYFADVVSGEDYAVRLNEFAAARFPHDLAFTRNLMRLYRARKVNLPQRAHELLRQHWWEAADLRDQYFEYLSSSGQIDKELTSLSAAESSAQKGDWTAEAAANPMAARFLGEAAVWRSHFEDAAPVLRALAGQYPADADLGKRAASLYRSLAAYNPANTDLAVAIEENLALSDPRDRETLARIGDTLADRELFGRAARYWQRIPQVSPGDPQGYLDAATIYWDYYDFDTALQTINAGRTRLGDATLYAYEAGAIYENKHEMARAIPEYVQGALKQHAGSQAYNRLLDLARRKALRDSVESATAMLTDGPAPALEAINLRIAVMEAEGRGKEVEAVLAAIAARTQSLELLEALQEKARQRSLEGLQQKVLEKQADVTTDPVRKLDLRYSLVRFFEGKKDLQQAQRNVEALYRDNPKIMGVVRSTVDFYWNHKQHKKAVDTLLAAARDAYPALATQFRFEAARKAAEAGDYGQARELLTQLLSNAPFNEDYMAAMADVYARSGDYEGLRKFNLAKIDDLKKAQLPAEQRTRQTAALRRGLVPALTRLRDYAAAVDQYIEVINRYPEDDALLAEAALYAQAHGRDEQLLGYYATTIQQSPKDYRWPMVLAKMQAQVENYSAAVDTYAAALKIRPERVDLRTARAALLERLARFDDAAAEYQKLYDLNYKDAQWMVKVAELRARQRRDADAVSALETALIANRAEKPSNYFDAARKLEGWGMLEAARKQAQKGVDVAGRDLLAMSENHDGAALYVEIMTRLRHQDEAWQRLLKATSDADSLLSTINVAVAQVEKNGITSVTDQQWRNNALEQRRQTARVGMQSSMQKMGGAVALYFTPEERQQFTAWLTKTAAAESDIEIAGRQLPAATAASLPELQATWLKRLMLKSPNSSDSYRQQYTELQMARMHADELGRGLEQLAAAQREPSERSRVQASAISAYRAAGMYDAELAAFRRLNPQATDERYLQLLLEREPQSLVNLAGSSQPGTANAAARYTMLYGGPELAQQAIAQRGHGQPAVWLSAYTGLTGLYQANRAPAVKTAFLSALGDQTIGERLGKEVDRDHQLAGDVWFYYGARYGAWLALARNNEAEDFLPAELERSPSSASGYVALAEFYADNSKLDRAVEDYRHALELSPDRADLRDRIAVLYWRQQKKDDAIAEWKLSLDLLNAQVHRRVVPPAFWSTFGYVLNHLGKRHLAVELRPQWEPVLRDYMRQNGTYQSDSLLRAAYAALGDPQAGAAMLLAMASISPEPDGVLQMYVHDATIPAASRNAFYEQIITRGQDHARTAQGMDREWAEERVRNWQSQYALHLLAQKDFDRAATIVQPHPQPDAQELQVQYRVALARNQFDAVVEGYRASPESAPKPELLRTAARALQTAEQRPAARKLLEFCFAQEIAAHQLSSANMLGLAEIRLQDGDTAGAMQLLRRLALVVGEPFSNLEPAAKLLADNGRHAEAVEFLQQLTQARPWDTAARLHLLQEQLAAGLTPDAAKQTAVAVARDPQAQYADRVSAAQLAAGAATALGSGELDYLASGAGNPDQPYYYAARVKEAQRTPDKELAARLLRNALADAPLRNQARAPLMHLLFNARQERLALLSTQPLLSSGYYDSTYDVQSTEESDATDSATDATDAPGGDEPDDTAPKEKPMKPSERSDLLLLAANCYLNLGELQSSANYYQAALRLQDTDAARKAVKQSLQLVKSRITRLQETAKRMPTIHDELEQDHVVRPRLAGAASPPHPARSTKEGGAR